MVPIRQHTTILVEIRTIFNGTHTHTQFGGQKPLSHCNAPPTHHFYGYLSRCSMALKWSYSSSRHQCTPISHSPNDHPSIIYEYVGNFEAASTFLEQSSKLKKFFFCLVYFALHTAVVHLGVCLRSLLHCMLTTRRGEPAVETE